MTEVINEETTAQGQVNNEKPPCPCKKNKVNGAELERKITAFADCGSQCIVWRMPYEVAVNMLVDFKETEKNKEQRDSLIRATSIASRRSRALMTALKENCVFND